MAEGTPFFPTLFGGSVSTQWERNGIENDFFVDTFAPAYRPNGMPAKNAFNDLQEGVDAAAAAGGLKRVLVGDISITSNVTIPSFVKLIGWSPGSHSDGLATPGILRVAVGSGVAIELGQSTQAVDISFAFTSVSVEVPPFLANPQTGDVTVIRHSASSSFPNFCRCLFVAGNFDRNGFKVVMFENSTGTAVFDGCVILTSSGTLDAADRIVLNTGTGRFLSKYSHFSGIGWATQFETTSSVSTELSHTRLWGDPQDGPPGVVFPSTATVAGTGDLFLDHTSSPASLLTTTGTITVIEDIP